jgi:uncharacterized membrane protein (DUF106 family)
MPEAAESLDQEVISDNKIIFEQLLAHLQKADSEILVATAWFTDDVLFNALLTKVRSGVQVDLIIADNEENQKLDFDSLSRAGATVLRVKNVGYGMMHQKFCVIDRRLVLHGSYNWSVNAKKNNHESIIITNHQETVASLVKVFFDIKQRAVRIMNGQPAEAVNGSQQHLTGSTTNLPAEFQPTTNGKLEPTDPAEDFRAVLDAMLAAETAVFDRDALRREGNERAKSTNGDANVLGNSLDSIYSEFVNAINLAEDKKRRIVTKIEDLKHKAQETCSQRTSLKIETVTAAFNTQREVYKSKVENLKGVNGELSKSILAFQTVKIPECQRKIEELKAEVDECEREFVKPQVRWFQMIPVIIFTTVLFLYLFLFYSSAAYILLFSEADAKEARMNGIEIPPPEVFHPQALSLVLERGWPSFLLVILFAIVPIGFACSQIFTDKKWLQIVFLVLGLTVVDAFIAAKVAKAIHEIDYLTGQVDHPFTFESLPENINFYLVFVLGALGLLLLKFAFGKFNKLMEERDPDIQYRKSRVRMKQLKGLIESRLAAMAEHQKDVQALNSDVVSNERQIEARTQSILELNTEEASSIEKCKLELSDKLVSLERTAGIYNSHVENDNIRVRVDALRDRISVYLEGWNDLLYREYSILRAEEKAMQARNVVEKWQNEKLVQERIDNRITT